jgi:long-chain acyl-CoA synthetase
MPNDTQDGPAEALGPKLLGPVTATTSTSIAETLFGHEAEYGHAPLLSVKSGDEGWRDQTVTEVAAQVRAIAGGLIATGIGPGDRVAIVSRSRIEWTLCDYAILSIGAVTVPIYETSSAEQIHWILLDSGAKAAFCESPATGVTIATLRESADGLADLDNLWCFDDGGIEAVTGAGRDVTLQAFEARRHAVRGGDLATIVYTSGTTGRPKGCELTHANCLNDLAAVLPDLRGQLHPLASTLLFLPIAHIFGRAIQIGSIATRTRLGYCPDVKDLASDLRTFRPTFVLAVPRVFEKVFNTAKTQAHRPGRGRVGGLEATAKARIFDAAERTAIAFSVARAAGQASLALRARHALSDRLVYRKLRAALGGRVTHVVSAGGPLGARLGHFFDGVGITVLEAYGLTETIAATFNWPHALRIGTVGRPVPGTTVRVANDGEILLRGPNIFAGYWQNDAGTAETMDGEWFKTGDLGRLDADGYLTITGRKKDLLVTSAGKNVAPAVLEDRLRAHRLVSHCLVVGDAKPFIACVITIDAEAWPDWAAEHAKAGPASDHLDDAHLRAEIQQAVDHANQAVSQAESIRKFLILADDFTEASGEMTPTLKLKRNVIGVKRAEAIESLYR